MSSLYDSYLMNQPSSLNCLNLSGRVKLKCGPVTCAVKIIFSTRKFACVSDIRNLFRVRLALDQNRGLDTCEEEKRIEDREIRRWQLEVFKLKEM
jgi:hypothetical protein